MIEVSKLFYFHMIFNTHLLVQAIMDIVTSRMKQYQAAMMRDDVFDQILGKRFKRLQDENNELRAKAALLERKLEERDTNIKNRIEEQSDDTMKTVSNLQVGSVKTAILSQYSFGITFRIRTPLIPDDVLQSDFIYVTLMMSR